MDEYLDQKLLMPFEFFNSNEQKKYEEYFEQELQKEKELKTEKAMLQKKEERTSKSIQILNGLKPVATNQNVQAVSADIMSIISKKSLPSQNNSFGDENDKPSEYDVLMQFISRIGIVVINEKAFVFLNKYYVPCSKALLSRIIVSICRDFVEELGTNHIVDAVSNFVYKEPSLWVSEASLPKNLLAFDNTVLDINTGIVQPHSRKNIIIYGLRANYPVDGRTTVFDEFLRCVSGGDSYLIQRIYEAIGYIISPDSSAKVLFLFQGVPNSGKSVLCNFIQSLFNAESVTTLDADSFGDRFSLSSLICKALCISPDLPAKPLDERAVSKIKQITGHDIIFTDIKYKDAVNFKCYPKLVFASNHAFRTKTRDEAFYDRIVTIPFAFSVPKEKQIQNLEDLIWQERDGIVFKALQAYFRLREGNYIFTGNFYPNQVIGTNNFDFESIDSLAYKFAIENFGKDLDSCVFTEDIHQKFCAKYNIAISQNALSGIFYRICLELYNSSQMKKRKPGESSPKHAIKGISWKENVF